jgi:LytS/YehU family sensor histidine kinase
LHGGIGALPGIAVILTSAVIGSIWRRWLLPKAKKKLRWLYVYLMGLAVHVVMMACMFLMPYSDSIMVVREITLPVIIIYPAATVLLYLLLNKQQAFWQMRDELKQSEEQYRQLYDDQKKAASELRQSELKYRKLFETMTQGVVCQGATGK